MASRESNNKPLPPRGPQGSGAGRRPPKHPAAAPVESIYNFKEPQPMVVSYDQNQMSAPEPVS